MLLFIYYFIVLKRVKKKADGMAGDDVHPGHAAVIRCFIKLERRTGISAFVAFVFAVAFHHLVSQLLRSAQAGDVGTGKRFLIFFV